ncbi:MAG: A/G-specific adenine glycosylase [Bdellovibrionota bacterium]
MQKKLAEELRKELLNWYRVNKRDLPWRKNRDPYSIWISEVMLQQTTVAAVVPYYEKFMSHFPNVETLARASESEVLEMWAGLGYYSRARNIHKSAKLISTQGFPQKAESLLELPGFGPYTSRAVASLSYNEAVGVLDGNVIRILSRVHGFKLNWWLPKDRKQLQNLSDELASTKYNSEINQGMMELGATVCTPKKPLCLLCPWKTKCEARKNNLIELLPLSKPKQKGELWHWQMNVHIKNNKIYLEKNTVTPFLTNLLFPPSKAKAVNKKPMKYDLKHSVTKYDIYIQIHKIVLKKSLKSNWFDLNTIKKVNHSSLMTKILKNHNNQVE